MKALLAMICAAALALPVGAAFARDYDEPANVTVSFADLDLSEPAGREALSRRIDAAVRRVCPSANGRTNLNWSARINACHASARADADRQLAAIYERRVFAQSTVRVRAALN